MHGQLSNGAAATASEEVPSSAENSLLEPRELVLDDIINSLGWGLWTGLYFLLATFGKFIIPFIVKPKQAGSCGRGIRNEHTSKSLICTNIKSYGTNSIDLLSRLLYFPSQRKLHVNGNLASWMILRASPTSAS